MKLLMESQYHQKKFNIIKIWLNRDINNYNELLNKNINNKNILYRKYIID